MKPSITIRLKSSGSKCVLSGFKSLLTLTSFKCFECVNINIKSVSLVLVAMGRYGEEKKRIIWSVNILLIGTFDLPSKKESFGDKVWVINCAL